MKTDELRIAFINSLPVICKSPSLQSDLQFLKIAKIIYSHNYQYQNICVSLAMVDSKGNLYTSNVKNVRLKDDISISNYKADCNVDIPTEIKELFINRFPVSVTEEPKRDYKEISEIQLELTDGAIKTTCVFSSKYARREVSPEFVVRDFGGHIDAYYQACDFAEYLMSKHEKDTEVIK
ncbi:MAG: hypothetical protein ACI4HO_02265 [Ruminococcus sp.]